MAKYNSLEELRAAKDKRFAEEKKNPYSAINTGRITKQNYSQVNPRTVSTGKSVPTSTAPTSKTVQTPELDAAVGNTPDFVAPSSGSGSERPDGFGENLRYTLETRIPLMLEGAGQQFLSSAAEAGRGIWDFLSDSYKYGETEESAKREDWISPLLTGYADEQARQAEESIATAKQGLGTVGQFLVDAGVAGTQMAADVGIAALTGGSSLAPMAVRSFGSGVQQARNKGYDLNQQMALGLGSAATEWATEKLFGGNPLYDQANSGVINKVIAKVTQNEDILKFLASRPIATLNEGLEEILSGVINPAIELAITGNADWPTVEELIRESAIGVALGGAGQVVNAVANRGNESSGNPLYDALTSKEQNAATGEPATAEELANILVGDSESTVVNTDPAEHTAVEQQVIEEYQASTDEGLVAFMEQSIQNRGANKGRYELKPVSDRAAADIKRITGVDTTGNKTIIEQRMAEHIYDRHGPNGQADQSMRDFNDFGRIQYVLDNYDYIADGGTTKSYVTADANGRNHPAKTVVFSKAVNGTYYVVEAVPDTKRKTTYIVSAYMSKNKTGASQTADAEAPAYTAEPENATTPVIEATSSTDAEAPAYTAEPEILPTSSEVNIPQNGQAVNSTQSTLEQTVPSDPERAPKESQTYDTVKSAKVTPGYMASLIDLEGEKDGFEYMPITNSETVQQATQAIMRNGWESTLADWTAKVRAGQAGDQVTATGALLYNNAVTAGDEILAMNILSDYSTLLRNTARGLQAARILKTLTPSSRLYMIQRQVSNFAEKLNLPDGVTISQELQQEYLNAKTEAERDKVIRKMQKHVAQQIPSTLLDKWTALRYVNMLGNFKTQIRNVVGNAAMRGTAGVKNLIATSLEHLVYSQDSGKRTKSFKVGKDLLDVGRKDFDTIQDIVLGESKYSTGEAEGFMKGVEKERQIFKFMPLEAYRKLTNAAMEGGDILFSKSAYARALAGYLKANGISADLFNQITSGEVEVDRATRDKIDNARAYAIQEAQEATFRDNNTFSSWISKIGRRPDTPKAGKLLSEGIMPFRKTPANVLVRAEEYSPLGLINTAVKAVQATKGTNDITGSDVINSLSKSLTGTGIFLLGMALRNAGWLTGGEDDEKQAGFNSLQGQQEYALSLPGDVNITLDWVSPASIPLFMGVQLMDEIEDGGFQLKDLEAAMTSITDPLIQMSMLQGANDTLDSIKYSDNNLVQIGVNAALSYLTQGLTNSLLGQAERTSEDKRMETYRDRDSDLPIWLQSTLGKASAKTPGWDYNQVDYVDAWGRTTDYNNPLMNALNQFINPSYMSEERVTEVETELQRLYDAGQSGVFPERRGQSDKVSVRDKDGNVTDTRYLTADEYVQANRTQGQTSFRLVSELMASDDYAAMDDDQRAEAIEDIYDYARDIATKEAEPTTKLTGMAKKAYEASKVGVDFTTWYKAYSEWKRLSDTDQEGYSAVDKATDFARWVDTAGFTKEQADTLKGQLTVSSGFTAETTKYNDLTGTGISAGVADQIYDAVSSLEPVNFNSTVANWQKYEAIAGSGATTADIDKAMSAYMSEETNDPIKYQLMRDAGYTPQEFAAAFHYYKTATSKDSFVKLVTAAGLDNAEKLYALMGANKKKLNNWKW